LRGGADVQGKKAKKFMKNRKKDFRMNFFVWRSGWARKENEKVHETTEKRTSE